MAHVPLIPEPQQAIVFAGSSIFYFWSTLAGDMAPLPVINQAFGGARMQSVLKAMDKLILPYNPRIIVLYCGSNDINDGAGPTEILDAFREFVRRVRQGSDQTRTLFVSINKAPQKQDRWDVIDSANTLIRGCCRNDDFLDYIDVNHVLVDGSGRPRSDLYLDDGLHFRPSSYRLFTEIIRPVLERAWQDAVKE